MHGSDEVTIKIITINSCQYSAKSRCLKMANVMKTNYDKRSFGLTPQTHIILNNTEQRRLIRFIMSKYIVH